MFKFMMCVVVLGMSLSSMAFASYEPEDQKDNELYFHRDGMNGKNGANDPIHGEDGENGEDVD